MTDVDNYEYESLEEYTIDYDRDWDALKPVQKSDYPRTIKVHIPRAEGHAKAFAELIGKRLSSDRRKFVYEDGRRVNPENATYIEKRKNLFQNKQKHLTRLESQHWKNTVEFSQTGFKTYITFEITFRTKKQLVLFAKRVRQRISPDTSYINYPKKPERKWKYHWVSKWEDCNPRYPFYIVSKGRADSRLTANAFERYNIPYHIVIEPQDYDAYASVIDEEKILVLPFSNQGNGPGQARNWCWDHSKKNGHKRHWVFDDNIRSFHRLHNGRRHPIADGGMFRVIEEFVDRYKNVPIAGPQYRFYAVEDQSYPAFKLNTRVYSALLIENSSVHRWRGRYNEDTIMCLDALKAGQTTMLFNCLIADKIVTQQMKGGNTEEFYAKEGTKNKSAMLEAVHPDVSKVVWRNKRFHHAVTYEPFKDNKLEFVDGYNPKNNRAETDLFDFERVRVS